MLTTHWRTVPPASMQLKRIALALGIPEPKVHTPAKTAAEAMREALSAGLPVFEGRPDDPMLDLLDL
ncbi:MAG: hypothetical protein HZC22_13395 [Rhodocyclales bacterium]|nr:hypothetical protein [Rhodocyclales bacterium]